MKIPHEIKKLSDCVQNFFFDNSDKSPNFKDIFQIISEQYDNVIEFLSLHNGNLLSLHNGNLHYLN